MKLSRRGLASRNQSECSLSLSLSLPPFFRAREAKPGAISMLVVNMLFLVAIAPDRALTARIMREDIFNRASAAAVLRSVTLTCNLQRCLACCAALGTANEGSRCRLSRRYREPPRASRDPEMTDDDDDDDDDDDGGSRPPLINSATERLPLFARSARQKSSLGPYRGQVGREGRRTTACKRVAPFMFQVKCHRAGVVEENVTSASGN